jgi:hypothetical protein
MAFASINQASVGGGSSNALSIQSDGIFMPRLSTGQRTALALTTSDAGLTVYDFTLNNLFIWNGTAWESIPGSGDAGANGSVQYNDNGIVSGASNFVYNKATSAVSITGDLTVDTNVLKVDTTLNRVGIGTATPVSSLQVLDGDITATTLNVFGGFNGTRQTIPTSVGTQLSRLHFSAYSTGTTYVQGTSIQAYSDGAWSASSAPAYLSFYTTPSASVTLTERYIIDSNGIHTWRNVGGVAATAMTLNSTGLLVGTTSTSGSSSNATSVVLGSARSADGIVSAPTAVATTIFTITPALRGRYEVLAMSPSSGNAALYTSIATVIWDGSSGRVVANNGTNLTITLSGFDVQITQISGSTVNIYWSFLRISLV